MIYSKIGMLNAFQKAKAVPGNEVFQKLHSTCLNLGTAGPRRPCRNSLERRIILVRQFGESSASALRTFMSSKAKTVVFSTIFVKMLYMTCWKRILSEPYKFQNTALVLNIRVYFLDQKLNCRASVNGLCRKQSFHGCFMLQKGCAN